MTPKDDLKQARSQGGMGQPARPSELVRDMSLVFPKVDANHDGALSVKEINQAVENSNLKGKDAIAVAALKLGSQLLPQLSPKKADKLNQTTLQDIAALERTGERSRLLKGALENYAAEFGANISSQPSLYSRKRSIAQSIVPEAVVQTSGDDCFFSAALAGLAQSDQWLIKEMITPNKNGTYTVTFPGAKNRPITVNAPSDAERALYAKTGEDYGVWPLVLTKAYGELQRPADPARRFERTAPEWAIATATILDGTSAERGGSSFDEAKMMKVMGRGITILTGREVEIIRLDQMESEEAQAANQKRLSRFGWGKDFAVVGRLNHGGTTTNDPELNAQYESNDRTFKKKFPFLRDDHAYSILSSSDGGASLDLRNPWGTLAGSRAPGALNEMDQSGGYFSMSYEELRRGFRTVFIPKPENPWELAQRAIRLGKSMLAK